MKNSKNIFGNEYSLVKVEKVIDTFIYHFLNNKNKITKIMMDELNEDMSWDALDSQLKAEKRMELLNFIYYHGPISGGLSVIDVEILAKGVIKLIDGPKQPDMRQANDYATDDTFIAQLLANAYNEGIRDTIKINK